MTLNCMIRELKKLRKSGEKTLEIYYAEHMSKIDDPRLFSVDVMNNYLNSSCAMAWSWTVISSAENEIYQKEFDDAGLADYEIVVHDEDFSDDVVCEAIKTWLVINGLEDLKFDVKMIELEDIEEYSGYIEELNEMDLDKIIEEAIPLTELDLE